MIKYLTSRLMIVFLFKFFICWAFNAYNQCRQFFDFNPSDDFFFKDLPVLLLCFVIALGLITINFIFLLFHLSEEYTFSELIRTIGEKGLLQSTKLFFSNFFGALGENINHFIDNERYPKIFLIFIMFYLPFVKGTPLLNNYYGIYQEYFIENQTKSGDASFYKEAPMFIIPRKNNSEIRSILTHLNEKYNDSELNLDVKKRGYIFLQAGLIDGFQTFDKRYKGMSSYIECLCFSFLEKLLNTILYFLIPFLIAISIYHYKFQK